jgi:lysophospholipase L1-like esterase
MRAAITEGYRALGAELGVAVAPAGQAWQTMLRQDPTIALWQDDGSHPSRAGTYLAACVLYARIFNASPVGISDTEGLSGDVARTLQVVADQP